MQLQYEEAVTINIELTYSGKVNKDELLINAAASSVSLCMDKHYKRGAEGWRNIIAFGDNLELLSAIYANTDPMIRDKVKSHVKLIYIDPPFATHSYFKNADGVKAYSDKKMGAEFIEFMRQRLILAREILAEDGSIYVHLDQKMSHYVKVIMDEVFGYKHFQNEIVWQYRTGGARNNKWSQKHDIILFYTKSKHWQFNPQKEKAYTKSTSRKAGVVDYGAGMAEFFEDSQGVYNWVHARDVWDIPYINSRALERTGYPTQKPEALLKKIIEASTNRGDLIIDFFGGSGVTMSVAEKLGRRWIVCDFGKLSFLTMQKRILQIPDCTDFVTVRLSNAIQLPLGFNTVTPPSVEYEVISVNTNASDSDILWLVIKDFVSDISKLSESRSKFDGLSAIFIDKNYDELHFHIDEAIFCGQFIIDQENNCVKIQLRRSEIGRQVALVFYDKYGNDCSNILPFMLN